MEIVKILRKLCVCKGIEILDAEAYPDHIHMQLSIPPKYMYGDWEFWCRGYYVDTVGRNKAAIEKHKNQLVEDRGDWQSYSGSVSVCMPL